MTKIPARSYRTARTRCLVPFCRRTKGGLPCGWDWICGPHWTALPKPLRRVYARAKRWRRTDAALARIWRRLATLAIERAGGIG